MLAGRLLMVYDLRHRQLAGSAGKWNSRPGGAIYVRGLNDSKWPISNVGFGAMTLLSTPSVSQPQNSLWLTVAGSRAGAGAGHQAPADDQRAAAPAVPRMKLGRVKSAVSTLCGCAAPFGTHSIAGGVPGRTAVMRLPACGTHRDRSPVVRSEAWCNGSQVARPVRRPHPNSLSESLHGSPAVLHL